MKEITPKPEQIQKISQIGADSGKTRVSTEQTEQHPSFEKILGREMQHTAAKTAGSDAAGGLPELEAVFPSQFPDTGFDRAGFTRKLGNSIDDLDLYAAWLSDSDKSLKQAWELLQNLSAQTRDLKAELDTASESGQSPRDRELADILNQLITTIRVEEIKLNRGDYSSET